MSATKRSIRRGLRRSDLFDEFFDADDIDDAREIIGQNGKRHFGGDPRQPLAEEVRCTHADIFSVPNGCSTTSRGARVTDCVPKASCTASIHPHFPNEMTAVWRSCTTT